MDRDELNKAAEEYALENAWYPGETSYESDIIAMEESFSDTFKRGADWLMQQPLSERLTEVEIAKAKAAYNRAEECYNDNADDMSYAAGLVVKTVLKEIFGADLFKEK